MDDFVARALKHAVEEKDISHQTVTDFLFSQGVVLDGVEAAQVCNNWIGRGLLELGDAYQEEESPSSQLTVVRTPEDEAFDEEDEEDEEESEHLEHYQQRRKSSFAVSSFSSNVASNQAQSFSSMRKGLRKKYPGLFAASDISPESRAVLRRGDSLSLSTCGKWVSRKKYSLPSRKRHLNVYLQPESEKAMSFHIVAAESFEQRLPSRREKSENDDDLTTVPEDQVVNYGDYVWLQSKHGDAWQVQFVCPGRSGAVRIGDSLCVVAVEEGKREHSTKRAWALSFSSMIAGTIGLQNVDKGDLSSPLWFTVHAQTFNTQGQRKLSNFFNPPAAEQDLAGSRTSTSSSSTNASRRTTKTSKTKKAKNDNLCVVVYNVWMFPSQVTLWAEPLFGTSLERQKRAELIPDSLAKTMREFQGPEYMDVDGNTPDVIVLCEAFSGASSTCLAAGLKRKFALPFETTVLGAGSLQLVKGFSLVNGGVKVLSRYPIVQTSHRLFKSAAHEDKFINKGVSYACIRRNQQNVHVFATHMQQGEAKRCRRARQLQAIAIREFIQDLNIPSTELVLVTGTLNCCKLTSFDEYQRMVDILGVQDPFPGLEAQREEPLRPLSSSGVAIPYDGQEQEPPVSARKTASESVDIPYNVETLLSYNVEKNSLSQLLPSMHKKDNRSRIADYCFFSKYHLQPLHVDTQVLSEVVSDKGLQWKQSTHRDLSNHFPLVVNFQLPPS